MNQDETIWEIYDSAMEIPEPFSSLSDEEKARVEGLLQSFEALEQRFGPLPHAEVIRPMLLAKCGRFEEALAFTDQQYRNDPNWDTAVAMANAGRRAGNLDLAVAMFTKSADHDPDDFTCWLEVGDIRLDQEQFGEALVAYEKALAKNATQSWALPSAFFCRHQLGIEGKWLASLEELANQEQCTCGLEGCLTSIIGGYGSRTGIERARELLGKSQGLAHDS